jgi:LPXTG-motif cell wall-anchored protein
MRKLMILPSVALGVLTLASMGGTNPASAAPSHPAEHASVTLDRPLYAGEDSDDDSSSDTIPNSGSGSGSEGDSGSLPSTGGDVSSIALVGGFALAAGGVMYRLSTRRSGALAK